MGQRVFGRSGVLPAFARRAGSERMGAGCRSGDFAVSVQFLDLRRTSGERMRRAAVIAVFQENQPVHDMIFTPDGQTLAVLVSTGAIHLWNLAQGRVERTLEL